MRGRFKNVDVWKEALRSAGVRTPKKFKAIFREKDEKFELFRKDFDKLQLGLVNGQLIRSGNIAAAKSSFNVFIMQVLGTGKMGQNYPVHINRPSTNKPLLRVIKDGKAPKEYYTFIEKYKSDNLEEEEEEEDDIESSIEDVPKKKKSSKRKRVVIQASAPPTLKFAKSESYYHNYRVKELSGQGVFYINDQTEYVSFGTCDQCHVIFPGSEVIQGHSFSDTVEFIHSRITKDLFGLYKIERVRNSLIHVNDERIANDAVILYPGDVIKIHTSEFEFV